MNASAEAKPGMFGFNKWLDVFVEEKGLDVNHYFTKSGEKWGDNLIPLSVVIEAAKTASSNEQHRIKEVLVKIDFKNGDVMHFFDYLAGGLAI